MSPTIRQTEEKYGIRSATLKHRLQKRLNEELEEGEEILWQGQPEPPKGAFSGCFFFVIIVGVWYAMSLSAVVMNNGGTVANLLYVFGSLIAVAIGFGLYSAHYERRASENTIYAVTDSRILILEHDMSVVSIPSSQMSKRDFSWDSQGYETLRLPTGKTHVLLWASPDGSPEVVAKYEYFSRVKDIRRVNQLIKDTFESNQREPQASIAPITSLTSLI